MTASASNRLDTLYSDASNRAGSGGIGDVRSSEQLIAFWAGLPDPGSLPVNDIIDATRIAIEDDGDWFLQYGASSGDAALVTELLRKLERDQGIAATAENVLVTNGAGQSVSLMVDMLVNPGDAVISEAPTWSGAVNNFKAAGAIVHEVPINADGLDTNHLESTLKQLQSEGKRAKFIYVIPTFQNPTGVTYTKACRQRIVDLAVAYDVPVIEDDAYFDLRYNGEKVPTLYSLDTTGHVVYIGTFSKIVAAGIRVGWLVAHPAVISRILALKAGGATSPFVQGVTAQFAASGTLVEHVQELRGLYAHRRDVMLDALADSMPDGVEWSEPEGGFFIWLRFPEGFDDERLQQAAADKGILLSSSDHFYFHGGTGNEIRLSYSFTSEEQIRKGIAILGELSSAQLGA